MFYRINKKMKVLGNFENETISQSKLKEIFSKIKDDKFISLLEKLGIKENDFELIINVYLD